MTNYGFSSLLPAVSGGKADIAACTIAITEERKESVNFSLPTYEGGVVTVAKSGPEEELPAIFRKFAQHVGSGALATAINRMARAILADGKIDMDEAAQLQQFLKGLEGQNEFRKALADARADGIITMEESANLENFLRKLIK